MNKILFTLLCTVILFGCDADSHPQIDNTERVKQYKICIEAGMDVDYNFYGDILCRAPRKD